MSHKNHNNGYTHYSKPQETAPVVDLVVTTPEVKSEVEPGAVNTTVEESTVAPVVEPVTPTPEIEPENTEFLGVVTECAKLNVRKEPSMDADVVTVLLIGAEVMVDKALSTEEFYKITTETGVEGYCKKDFIII